MKSWRYSCLIFQLDACLSTTIRHSFYMLQYDTVNECGFYQLLLCYYCFVLYMTYCFVRMHMNTCIDPGAITDFSGGYTPCLAGQSEEMGKSLGHSEETG